MLCSVRLSEQDHRYGDHQHADDEIADDDRKQALRTNHSGQHGQPKVCQVWKAGIHCKHACGWRSTAERYASKPKAHGPCPHQRDRQGQEVAAILKLAWRETEHADEQSRWKGNGDDKRGDGTYALRVEHSEPAYEPTQSGDEHHGNQSLKDRLEHCRLPLEGISDVLERHFSYCEMLTVSIPNSVRRALRFFSAQASADQTEEFFASIC